jgi:S1-C subfamily serine protease
MLTWLMTMCLICAPVPKLAHDPLGHGYLGVFMTTGQVEGVQIQSLVPGLPAAMSGLQVGDKILQINRNPIKNNTEASECLSPLRPGTEIQLQVERAGEKKNFRIVLTARPERSKLQDHPITLP